MREASDRHKYPSEEAERFQVRLPAGLRNDVRAAAVANGRSMNAEIVARIEAAADGESLRDRFAGRALVGLLSGKYSSCLGWDEYADDAYALADAMLKARESTA